MCWLGRHSSGLFFLIRTALGSVKNGRMVDEISPANLPHLEWTTGILGTDFDQAGDSAINVAGGSMDDSVVEGADD